MHTSTAPGNHTGDWRSQTDGGRDLATQLVLSILLGLSAFFSFCVRPHFFIKSIHDLSYLIAL